MEINAIWEAIAPYVTGTGIGAIIGAILGAIIKSMFNKTLNKIDVDKIATNATEKVIEKMQNVSFSQNIQPIVNSELEKVNEKANEYVTEKLDEMKQEYTKLLNVMEKFSNYFDGNYFVSDETKAELKTAFEQAKVKEPISNDYTVKIDKVEEEVKETQKTAETQEKATKIALR